MQKVSGNTTDTKGREAEVKNDFKTVTDQDNNIVTTAENEEEVGEVNQQQNVMKINRSRGKDVWFCADPGCRKGNLKSSDVCEQCGFSAKMSKDFQAKRGDGDGRVGKGGYTGGVVKWVSGEWDKREKLVLNYEDPVLNMFGKLSNMLDVRQYKMERIIKLGQAISFESKRIIFCLHRIKQEEHMAAILGEAEGRLGEVKEKLLYYLARELKGVDHYLFIQAYSAGLKEWVKAVIFLHYMTFNKIISFKQMERELVFVDEKAKRKQILKADINDNRDIMGSTDSADGVDIIKEYNEALAGGFDELSIDPNSSIMISVTFPQSEYILGLADFTGELMKNIINSLVSGNTDVCFTLLDILQNISEGFIGLPKCEAPKNIGQKMLLLKQNCEKVEHACYAITIRGSEIPKTHLADLFVIKHREEFKEEERGYFSD